MSEEDDRTVAALAQLHLDSYGAGIDRALRGLRDELYYIGAGGPEVDAKLAELAQVLEAKRGCRR